MRRGPLLGITVFLVSSIGGYRLGLHRRAQRLKRERAAAEREASKALPIENPVAVSTEAIAVELPSDTRRPESVPRVLE